jgi:hypothetical protein
MNARSAIQASSVTRLNIVSKMNYLCPQRRVLQPAKTDQYVSLIENNCLIFHLGLLQ